MTAAAFIAAALASVAIVFRVRRDWLRRISDARRWEAWKRLADARPGDAYGLAQRDYYAAIARERAIDNAPIWRWTP